MATILTKKKDTTGAPAAGDLTNAAGGAELAVNTADKRLYTKDSGGNVVEVGTNPGAAVTFTAGTAGAPAITTTGDTNTGIFFPAADTIAFAEGGAEAMRIDSSGNVGIGTSSPAEELHIYRGSATGTYLRAENTVGLLYAGVRDTGVAWVATESDDPLAFGTNGTERMRMDSSGNVGIGTSSPSYKLDVQSTGGTTSQFYRTDGTYVIQLKGGSTTSVGAFGMSTNDMVFLTNAAERMRIDSSGNVGIGTTTPNYGSAGSATTVLGVSARSSAGLGVINTNGTRTSSGQVTGIINFFNNGGATPLANVYGIRDSSDTTGSLAFGTNDTERARITSGGIFCIGTTGVLINESSLAATSNGNTVAFKTTVASGDGAQPLLLWNASTTNNNLFTSFFTETSYTLRGSIDYNRGAGQVRYNTTSDATLKNIIGDADGQRSVDILNTTRLREYAWKDDPDQNKQIGVIAQELHETFKGAVSVGGEYVEEIPAVTEQRLVSEAVLDEEGNEVEAAVYETVEIEPSRTETKYRPWAVDKTAFTFHLVAGWQAHEKKIAEQQARIEALEAQNAAFEARLAALEAK